MHHLSNHLGTFTNGTEYRQALEAAGYTDLGWQNGWGEQKQHEWAGYRLQPGEAESHQWNNSGTDVTYVLHGPKVFCSVDMGD